ncbi:hypothetical protein H6A68_08940, partial [Bifidobacterium pullorum subsp. saeculare]|nr:hypothetical protein [Bifidobacterium pullorum subsp. saeculare]
QHSLSAFPPTTTPQDIFNLIHGNRRGHPGVKRTWDLLNKEYPGHNIPLSTLSDMVANCPTCQKVRLGMIADIQPLIL